MRHRTFSISVLFFLLCVALFVQVQQASSFAPVSEPIPASFFGLHIHHAATTTAWPHAPFTEWRLWDAYVAWPNLEPRRGQWRFQMLDRYVSLAEEHNIHLLLPLGLSPGWASARPEEHSTYQPGNAAEPKNIEDWRRYVRTVATRYKGRIHEYEIWNEPNLKIFFSGDVSKMVELTREASEIIHEIDPQATIVSPSATAAPGVNWLSEFLRQGGGQYVDVIGFHFYVMPQPPEAIAPLIQKVREEMQDNGAGQKPLWNTETAWSIPKPFPSQELGAAYLARTYLLSSAGGIQRLYWYSWDNHNWVSIETTERDSETLTPAGRAYGTVSKWLVGARMEGCSEEHNHTWICKIERDGTPQWIVWNTDRTLIISIPESWRARFAVTAQGESKELRNSSLDIGQMPTLISATELQILQKDSR